MDEEIWEIYDHATGREGLIKRTEPGQYELTVSYSRGGTITVDLDRKNLKDLCQALAQELGWYSEPEQRNMVTGDPIPSEFEPRRE